MFGGCYTALATPFCGDRIDYVGLERLVEFQIASGVSGVLSTGTTAESPTLSWEEHYTVTKRICALATGRCQSIAGAGSNATKESLAAARHARDCAADAVLLVDPYYNGPSSLEIRREYVSPIASQIPDIQVIPYIIPGRTGTQLLPEDLGILHNTFPNVRAVKEATGDLGNMERTRACCGDDFDILSGDDNMTVAMMTNPRIRATGVMSVASNVAPKAVQQMTMALSRGDHQEASQLHRALEPLFDIVTVKTLEHTPYGQVVCKARNPLATKTLMNVLGMPAGPCRPPLGRMTRKGLEVVLEAARRVYENAPDILAPVGEFFGVDIEARLAGEGWRDLCYED